MSAFKPTLEQKAIFSYIKDEKGNLVVMARAGCGKTTSIVEALNHISWSASVTFLCFNKHIQEEIKKKVPKNVMVYTTHGLGYAAIMRKNKGAKFDELKMIKIINKLGKKWNTDRLMEDQHMYYGKLLKIANLAKQTISLDKASLQFLVRKYEISIDKEGKDLDRVLKILEKSVEDTKTFDYADMIFLPATDPKIWMFPQDYVFVDESQDLNRSQQFMINKMLKKDKLKNTTGRLIAIGDGHQCQPPDTKILMSDGSEKPIKDIKIGDQVVSYEKSKMCRFLGFYKNHRWGAKSLKIGMKVMDISKTQFNGNLVVVKSNNKITKYTPNHRCYARFNKEKKHAYALYLMERNGLFRIGIHPILTKSGDNSFKQRAHGEKANKMWILNIYSNKMSAYLDEQYYSLMFGIPQMIFEHRQQKGNINQDIINSFYERIKNGLFERTCKLLENFNKNYEYPFFEKEKHNKSITNIFELRACNLFPSYMDVIHFDENNFKLKKTKTTPYKIYKSTYHNIDFIGYENYSGDIYSLKIEKYETYVGDGIMTHNSIQGFAGSDNKSFEWFTSRPNTKVLPLTYSFRCAKNIISKAQVIVEDIKPLPLAEDGIVRTGSALDEASDSDFILCRKSKPLLVMFFQLLLKGKKSFIKGIEMGENLIDKAKDFTTKEEMNKGLSLQLEHYRTDLISKGIFNYEENFGFSEFKDTVESLNLLSKTVKNMDELKSMINNIFKKEGDGIVLSTIHKSKGLEANRVFIILPKNLPYQEMVVDKDGVETLEWVFHMKQNQQWMKEQELNLKYVAITRAKKELIFDEKWSDEKPTN